MMNMSILAYMTVGTVHSWLRHDIFFSFCFCSVRFGGVYDVGMGYNEMLALMNSHDSMFDSFLDMAPVMDSVLLI